MLHQLAEEMGRDAPELTPGAVDALVACDFPGNVRQLKNALERLLIENKGAPVQARDLYFLKAENGTPAPNGGSEVPLKLDELERWGVHQAMLRTRGNVSEAARVLGVSRNRVYRSLAAEDCAQE